MHTSWSAAATSKSAPAAASEALLLVWEHLWLRSFDLRRP